MTRKNHYYFVLMKTIFVREARKELYINRNLLHEKIQLLSRIGGGVTLN